MDDATLICKIAANDPEAMGAFHARWFPQFARLATRLTGDETLGEDIAQEAVVRVIMAAGKYQPGRKARSWLLAILYNLVRDDARRKKVRKATPIGPPPEEDESGPGATDVPDREPTPEERAHARERQEAVCESLARLSPDDRAVIVLRDYEGLSAVEAAQVLEITPEKVGSRLFRARQRMRAQLLTDWPGLFPSHEM